MLGKVLLGQVLEVSLGEWDLGLNNDVGLLVGDGDSTAKVVDLLVDLDVLLEVVLEVGHDHDVIVNWVEAVDGVSVGWLLGLGCLGVLDRKTHV